MFKHSQYLIIRFFCELNNLNKIQEINISLK